MQLGSGCWEGTRAAVYGQSLGRRLRISKEKHATVFQAKMLSWPVLVKFEQIVRQENMLVFALTVRWLWKPFRLLKRLHWYNSAKDAEWHFHLATLWRCLRVPGHSGVLGNENANKLARDCTIHQFGLNQWQNAGQTANILWCGGVASYLHPEKGSKLISRTSPTPQTRLLSCNRTQSRVVTGLLNVHNTLRKHLYLMWLTNSPLCRWCEEEEETSAYVLCECEALTLLKHAYLGSIFLGPRGHKIFKTGSHLELQEQGSHDLESDYGAQQACLTA